MMKHAVIRKPGEGKRVGIVGDVYRFLATGAETDGKYAAFEASVAPGGGPPPHIHSREEEMFFVLEGELTFQLNGETILASPGTFLNMPIGSLHCFKNETDETARMIITVAPAGLDDYFAEVGQLVADGENIAPQPTEADILNLISAAPRYGLDIKVP